jgi:hypothetical protein
LHRAWRRQSGNGYCVLEEKSLFLLLSFGPGDLIGADSDPHRSL